ncbi:MAG TPA: sensor histidine kinase, partial [Chloroflexota bacterium]|nr:sensor histidine kinase [Chloroflexota bacterium]
QLLLLLDSQSARLSRLVEHVLDLTWDTPAGHPLTAVPTDLAALVREAVRSVSLDPARHPVDLQLPSQPLMAQVDADRVVQVVIDLLDNAARFSPEGGRIEVTLVRDGHSAALAVRDHGAGIPAEQLPHVFERFYQGHADTHLSGLGLGLFVARRVVEAHGGTIALIPATGGGTRVVVTLPSLAT